MNSETRIAAQDYVEIQNLYSLYNLSSDEGNSEVYARCFTENGILINETFGTTVQGREALIAFKIKEAGSRKDKVRRHWNGSLYLERISVDTVRGRCYLQGYTGDPGHFPEVRDVAVYEDLIVKEGEAWKFAKRILRMDASTRMGSNRP